MHATRRTAALAAALLALPCAAAAQVPGVDLLLAPKVGAYVPTGSLGETRQLFGLDRQEVDLEPSLAIGLAAELDLPFSPVNLRANFDYATESEISLGETETTQGEPRTTLLALTGDLVLRPLPRIAPIQPYLLAGGGIKRYDFQVEDAQGGLREFVEDAGNDWTLHIGAGVDLRLGPLALFVEVSDYVSWFESSTSDDTAESRLQNDVFAMAGFRVGMF